jgi:hypothetical protein
LQPAWKKQKPLARNGHERTAWKRPITTLIKYRRNYECLTLSTLSVVRCSRQKISPNEIHFEFRQQRYPDERQGAKKGERAAYQ